MLFVVCVRAHAYILFKDALMMTYPQVLLKVSLPPQLALVSAVEVGKDLQTSILARLTLVHSILQP